MIAPRAILGTILHFTPSLGGGGAEVMLTNLVESMRGGSWRQVVVAVHTGTTGCQAGKMRGLADAFYDLDSNSMMRPRLWSRLYQIIRRESPDVVQTWMHHQDFFGGIISRLAGVRHIAWGVHNPGIYRWPGDSEVKFQLFKKAITVASKTVPEKIISCSNDAIDYHAGLGYPRAAMSRILNGICTTRFKPDVEAGVRTRDVLGVPLDVPLIGFVGRFHPIKDLANFFRAAALLWEREPRTRFVLNGGTPDSLYPEARAAYDLLTRKEQIHFAPFTDRPENIYPALSIFSLSSDGEALPMALLEAMSCGTPCVTTSSGDCAHVVADTGLVVPMHDSHALADAWEKTIRLDAPARASLSARARQRVIDHFSIAYAASQYEQAYRSMLHPIS